MSDALILGTSKTDCETFAAEHGIEDFAWASPKSPTRIRGLSVKHIYATEKLLADRDPAQALINEAEFARA